jgi:hypothetical protein
MALEGFLMMLAFAGQALALFGGWAVIAAYVYVMYVYCKTHYTINEHKMSAHLH